jgi:NAD(P)-dependent dehydrogenase (short-subunit alcohol dehydrogenase family)
MLRIAHGAGLSYNENRDYFPGSMGNWNIANKTCLITGGNTGIGRETALALAVRGAKIVLVCRDPARGRRAQAEVSANGMHPAELLIGDLSLSSDVRHVAQQYTERHDQLHVLIHNVGVVMPKRQMTREGVETTFATNHLCPFLLTDLLLDTLGASTPARIIVVASQIESRGQIYFDDLNLEQGYQPLKAYDQSKLANVLFTYELARRLSGKDISVNCLHPGVIATNLLCDYMGRPRALSKLQRLTNPGPKKGAETSIHLATDPRLDGVSGKYFKDKIEANTSKQSYDAQLAKRLWQVSEAMVASKAKR